MLVATLLPDLAVTPRFRAAPERDAGGRLSIAFNDALRRAAAPYAVTLVDLYAPNRDEVPRRPELVWQAVLPLTAAR